MDACEEDYQHVKTLKTHISYLVHMKTRVYRHINPSLIYIGILDYVCKTPESDETGEFIYINLRFTYTGDLIDVCKTPGSDVTRVYIHISR
eukprot:c15986_g1_i1 orf=104-376(+)